MKKKKIEEEIEEELDESSIDDEELDEEPEELEEEDEEKKEEKYISISRKLAAAVDSILIEVTNLKERIDKHEKFIINHHKRLKDLENNFQKWVDGEAK